MKSFVSFGGWFCRIAPRRRRRRRGCRGRRRPGNPPIRQHVRRAQRPHRRRAPVGLCLMRGWMRRRTEEEAKRVSAVLQCGSASVLACTHLFASAGQRDCCVPRRRRVLWPALCDNTLSLRRLCPEDEGHCLCCRGKLRYPARY